MEQLTPEQQRERIVLGSMLLSSAAVGDVADVLVGSDFADGRHEAIYDALLAVRAAGQPVDALSVADRLAGDLARCGGPAYLHELAGLVASPSSAGYHAQRVKADALRRKLRAVASRIGQWTEDPDVADGDELLNLARHELDAVERGYRTADELPLAQTDVFAAVEELEGDDGALATPWAALTETIGGWKPGSFYLLGARPSVGKSVVGIQAAVDMARRHGHAGVVFSMEMGRTEIYHRILSSWGRVNASAILHRRLSSSDWERIQQASDAISRLPLVVDDRASLTVAKMRARVRAAQRRGRVGLVVVDYVQLAQAPAGAARHDRRTQVDAISRECKIMAKELEVPVLGLAQLNRGPEGRMDPMPRTSDLREGGGLEQDADVVMLAHRPLTTANGADPTDLRIVVGKNRHGPAHEGIQLVFRGHYSRADDPGERWSGQQPA